MPQTQERSLPLAHHPATPYEPLDPQRAEETDLAPLDAASVRVYLNNAATTWPKPDPVIAAVDACLRHSGSAMRQDGGRGGDLMAACRGSIAELLNAGQPDRVTLLPGCTYATNLAILGLPWAPGDAIAISGLEHHAVSRPARKVSARLGVRLLVSPYRPGTPYDLDWLRARLVEGRVRLVATTYASNLTGEILPIAEIVALAKSHGALTLVDAAQAAGLIPIDLAALGCDMLAFAGHKGLMGPLGVGGLWLRPGLSLDTLAEGGTGGDSGKHELSGKVPSTYEVGSHNLPAIAGLHAGVRWLTALGVERLHRYEASLADALRSGLAEINGLRLLGAPTPQGRTPAVAFNAADASGRPIDPKRIAAELGNTHGIACRAGFHCAPLAHESAGTLELGGAVRLSPGFFNTHDDILETHKALNSTLARLR